MSAPTKPRRRWIPRWLKVVLLVFLVPVIAYGVLAWRYWRNPPRPTRNYVAEYNAEIEKIPEDQRAWPRYREAYKKLEPLLNEEEEEEMQDEANFDEDEDIDENSNDHRRPRVIRRATDIDLGRCRPGGLDWESTVAYLREHQRTLADVRAATALPYLGYELTDGGRPEDLWPPEEATPASENPILLDVTLPPAQYMRDVNRVLICDAYLAIEEGDQSRVGDNFVASLDMAEHMYQMQAMAADLTAVAYLYQTTYVLLQMLSTHSQQMDDAQLRRVEDRLRKSADRKPAVRIELDREMFADILQRIYSDDGDGDGAYHLEANMECIDEVELSFLERLTPPLIALFAASRCESADAYDYLMESVLAEYSKPYWLASFVEFEQRFNQVESRRGFFIVSLMFPPVISTYESGEHARLSWDVVLTAIALERFRRANGQWPQKLDQLLPTYLAAVPPDRFDGQPLRYRFVDGRPTLYSIGWDRVDQEGAAAHYTSIIDASDRLCEGLNFSLRTPHDAEEIPQGDWILWRGPADAP